MICEAVSIDRSGVVSGSSLGSNTDFSSRASSGNELQKSGVEGENGGEAAAFADYCRRQHARRVAGGILKLTASKRVQFCGWRLTKRADGVGLWMRPDRERGRISGVCLCGSSWSCPVCAPRIAAGRVGEVKELAAVAEAQGFGLVMETFTVPHYLRDEVASVIRTLQGARSEMSSGRSGEVLREGRVGYVDAGELTWGDNGAHPHTHRMSVIEPGRYDTAGQRAAWLAALQRCGRWSDAAERHAYHVQPLNTGSAWYISKIGLEVASSALATKDSITPLGMVYRMADGTLPRMPWAARFRECATALTQTKFAALRFSRGLRKRYGLSSEKSDQELCQEETTETDQLLGYLDELQWLGIRRRRLDAELVFVAQQGKEAVNAWMRRNGLGWLREDRQELVPADGISETTTIETEDL